MKISDFDEEEDLKGYTHALESVRQSLQRLVFAIEGYDTTDQGDPRWLRRVKLAIEEAEKTLRDTK